MSTVHDRAACLEAARVAQDELERICRTPSAPKAAPIPWALIAGLGLAYATAVLLHGASVIL